MSNGRKLLFVVSFIIIDVLLVSSIIILRDLTNKNILSSEVNALVELDFTKDNYNIEVRSSHNYAIVEKAIKKYLDGYAKEVQNILKVRYDQKLNKMLTLDNYVRDGPLFSDSLGYIDALRNDFNYSVDILMERVNEDVIHNYIYNYDVDQEDVKLYNNLLLQSKLINKIEENQIMLAKKRIEFNSYFDSIYNVLVYLKDNYYTYHIVDEKIVFIDINAESKYYELLNEVKRIYN